MEFQEIDAKGIIKIERVTTATFPTTAYHEGRLVFNTDTDKMFYGTGAAWVEVNDASSLAAHIAATSAHGASGNIVGATTLNGAITTHAASTNHPLATTSAKGFLKQLSNDANQYMNGQGNWTNVTIPDGDGSKRTITQSRHGFSVGNLLYLNGTTYTKAIATTAVTAEVVGMVSIVNSVDQFVLTTSGYVSGGIGALTAGQVYFLSDSVAGAMTTTEPTTDGYVSKPIFIASSTTEGYLINWRGIVITSSSVNIISNINKDDALVADDVPTLNFTGNVTVTKDVVTNSADINITSATGTVVQVVSYQRSDFFTGTGYIPFDNTTPLISEGDLFLTLSITPKSATNKLKIDVLVNGSTYQSGGNGNITASLFKDGIDPCLATGFGLQACGLMPSHAIISYMMPSAIGTTSPVTFAVRTGGGNVPYSLNGGATNGVLIAQAFNGTYYSSITITEIAV